MFSFTNEDYVPYTVEVNKNYNLVFGHWSFLCTAYDCNDYTAGHADFVMISLYA